jgi:hypothetical protein
MFFFLVLCVVAREYYLRVQYASVFINAQVFGLVAASLVDSTRFRSNLCELTMSLEGERLYLM